MLNVIRLNVIVLNIIRLSVIVLSVIVLNVILLNVILLNVILLNVIMPSVAFYLLLCMNIILLNVIRLNVIRLHVIRLSVVAPFFLDFSFSRCQGNIRTLNLRIVSQLFYPCATRAQEVNWGSLEDEAVTQPQCHNNLLFHSFSYINCLNIRS
jgi:hypothetical protein